MLNGSITTTVTFILNNNDTGLSTNFSENSDENNKTSLNLLTQILSKKTLAYLLLVNSVIIIFIISSVGSALNMVNIVVFLRQGVKDPVTITLLVLSFSDFGSVITLWFQSIFLVFHFFPNAIQHLDPRYLMGFMSWPHSIFNRVGCLLTVFIALERWVCVTFPLRANRMITTMTSKIFNTLVMVYCIGVFIALFIHSGVGLFYFPRENRSLYAISLTSEGLKFSYLMSNLITSIYFATYILLIVFTSWTVVVLNRQSKWRKAMSASSTTIGAASSANEKSNKVVKMVVVICLLYITCTIPSIANTMCYILIERYSTIGPYFNLHTFLSQITFTFEVINSSSNFFVYYHMSSNFKNALNKMLRGNASSTNKLN